MAAPTEVLKTGQAVTLMEDRIKRSLTSIDEGTLTYCVPTKYYFTLGTAPPTYPHMRIHDIDEKDDAGDFIVTLTCRGLANGSGSKIIGMKWSKNALGYDDCNVTVIVANSDAYNAGDSLQGHPLMFLMEKQEDDYLDDKYRTLSLKYSGIAWSKLETRVITVNENIQSGDTIEVTFPGGWPGQFLKSQVSWPTIVVTDTVVTTAPPPTILIPGAATPPNPPTIQSIGVSGSDLTYHWPHEWKLSSINGPELFRGAGVYTVTLVYEYQWPITIS